jgi:hypothetical protein
VTVPVARASARRTVRVAAGLVAGQAVLCAVIGYVTLGGHGSGGTTARGTIDPLAAEPFRMPIPRVPPLSPTNVAPQQPATAKFTSPRPPAGTRSRHHSDVTPAPTPPPAAEPAPDILVATSLPTTAPVPVPPSLPGPDATSIPASTESAAPSPPVSESTTPDVQVGAMCNPVNARGLTTDGKAALCVSETDGVLRWQTTE